MLQFTGYSDVSSTWRIFDRRILINFHPWMYDIKVKWSFFYKAIRYSQESTVGVYRQVSTEQFQCNGIFGRQIDDVRNSRTLECEAVNEIPDGVEVWNVYLTFGRWHVRLLPSFHCSAYDLQFHLFILLISHYATISTLILSLSSFTVKAHPALFEGEGEGEDGVSQKMRHCYSNL